MHFILLGAGANAAIHGELLRAALALALPCCWQSCLGPESPRPVCGSSTAEMPEEVEGRGTRTYQDRHGCDLSPRRTS